jgi:hypothetical protein
MPAFEYKGPLVGMAAFNEHCTLGFWKASLMKSDATRARRLETAVGWIAEGKGRNWKYER